MKVLRVKFKRQNIDTNVHYFLYVNIGKTKEYTTMLSKYLAAINKALGFIQNTNIKNK